MVAQALDDVGSGFLKDIKRWNFARRVFVGPPEIIKEILLDHDAMSVGGIEKRLWRNTGRPPDTQEILT